VAVTDLDFDIPVDTEFVNKIINGAQPGGEMSTRQDSGMATKSKTSGLPGVRATRPAVINLPAEHLDRMRRHTADLVANVGDDPVGPNTEGAEPTPTPPVDNTVPATISHELSASKMKIKPEWHQVSSLPGNMRQAIRRVGAAVFGEFTTTPTDDIWAVATLTNPEHEVKALYNWVKTRGQKVSEGNIDFSQTMPGYDADVEVWRVGDAELQLVKDFAGYYIYGWNASTSKLDAPNDVSGLLEGIRKDLRAMTRTLAGY